MNRKTLKKSLDLVKVIYFILILSINGIAARGYVHRLVNHGERQYTDGKGNHINGLEGFWGYLKRKLSSKGGIRRDRLPLYLAEYVWRYNHRSDAERIKIRRIIQLLEKS
jgi:transposase